MKTLYLLRHAKAAVEGPGFDDHERALTARGNEDAPRMAEVMAARGYVPEVILCSSARRAQETCRHVHAVMDAGVPTRIEPDLYLAPNEIILSLTLALRDNASSVLIIGHNPGLEELGATFGAPPKLPTTGLGVFEFDVENWKDVSCGTGRLVDFLTPKIL